MNRIVAYTILLVALGGCTAHREVAPLTPNHPASPEAAEAPALPASETLRVESKTAPPDENDAAATRHHNPGAAKPAYSCPMHSEITSATAGRCPKCGMNLTLKAP